MAKFCINSNSYGAPLKEFVCVEFPGSGDDINGMMETLGGINSISKSFNDNFRRLEMKFRPKDPYCKSAYGESVDTASVLIKVRKRKKPKQTESSMTQEAIEIELVGLVSKIYKFDSLSDFQYLPIDRKNETNKMYSIYSELLPKNLNLTDWFDEPAPIFVVPNSFSRLNYPQDYKLRNLDRNAEYDVFGRGRERRCGFTRYVSFKADEIPREPLPTALAQGKVKIVNLYQFEKLKAEFDDRAIWSKAALISRLGISKEDLKFMLPMIAYYFCTGPWRTTWVKLGCDPRKDSSFWKYQIFDFRIRQVGGIKNVVEAKRTYSASSVFTRKKTPFFQVCLQGVDPEPDDKKKCENTESSYIFRPGSLPPYRQMFYQFCDVHVPEIQRLLKSSVKNTVCDEKLGWIPPGVEGKCRDILTGIIEKTVKDQNSQI